MAITQMESYPPTLEDLRKSFLALHPGYEFGETVDEFGTTLACPLESDGKCDMKGFRCAEWRIFVYQFTNKLRLEVNGDLPNGDCSTLYYAESFYSNFCLYNKVVLNLGPRFGYATKSECENYNKQKQQEFKQKLLFAKEWKSKATGGTFVFIDDDKLIYEYYEYLSSSRGREIIVERLCKKAKITPEEAEFVLAHLDPTIGLPKNTLEALKIINRFASEHGIRFDDAIVVIREYAICNTSWSKI
jgi:hypothetical protein